jgi:hypothetical protein
MFPDLATLRKLVYGVNSCILSVGLVTMRGRGCRHDGLQRGHSRDWTVACPYILRLVQQYEPSAVGTFFELEAQFQELERKSPGFPQGKQNKLLSVDEPTNVLVWESEFALLLEVQP